ncbi:MAG: universal stress protein [Methanobacteriota archaeon]
MKRILVGFDGSEGAENALNKAMSLIDEDGELILIAVVPSPNDKTFVDKDVYTQLKTKARSIIDTVITDIGEHEYLITGLVEEGDVAATIIDIANKLNCNLIILGSRGASEIGHYPIGSVATKVVQYARKPVMIVR